MWMLEEQQMYLRNRTGALLPTYSRQDRKARECLAAALGDTKPFASFPGAIQLIAAAASGSGAANSPPSLVISVLCALSTHYSYHCCNTQSIITTFHTCTWPYNKAAGVYFDLCRWIVHTGSETKRLGLGSRINKGLCFATSDGLCWLFNKSNGTCHK